MREFTADFEANTTEPDCRVWGWGVAEISKNPSESFRYGHTVAELINHTSVEVGRYWFHNLAYDGKFIIAYLLQQGYRWTSNKPELGEFSTLISNLGKFYKIELKTEHGKLIFADSFKKITMGVAAIGETYELSRRKGELDYHTVRPIGYIMTQKELAYLKDDVLIMAEAMADRLQLGKKLTTGADCLANYIDLIGQQRFNQLFPKMNRLLDASIRKAYRGGFVYVNPKHKNVVLGEGGRLDVNSLYPWVQRECLMPCGMPKRFKGEPSKTEKYPLWVAEVTFSAKLKQGGIPCIQMRNNSFYADREYITETLEPATLWFSNVDWELITDMYDVTVFRWSGGYSFAGSYGMFDDYVDFGMQGKNNAKNGGQRLNHKLWLNNLGGKFGQKIDVAGKKPVMGADGVVKYVLQRVEEREPVYIPVAVFMTAYARDKTLRTAQLFGDRFVYCDTDSIHFLCEDIPPEVEVHPKKLGAWKLEALFTRAIFIRAKTYAEEVRITKSRHKGKQRHRTDSHRNGTKIEYTCAGMSDKLKDIMLFDDFRQGFTTDARRGIVKPRYADPSCWGLKPKNCVNGVILIPTPFTIH